MTPEREKKIKSVIGSRQAGLLLVLEDIHDPHNAQAITRTADALGIQDIWLVFQEEKAWNPRRVGKSSSSSANKWLSFRKFKTSRDCVRALKRAKFSILVTTLNRATRDLYRTKLTTARLAVVVGNEHRGVSQQFVKHADHSITIPMRGFVESLNVSVAAGLILAEVVRQRQKSRENFMISKKDQKKLFQEFSKK